MKRWIVPAIGILVVGGFVAMLATSHKEEPAGPVVGFYGDSYTLGTGASDYSKRWSSIISKDRGWVEVNPSVNGLGFINNRSFPYEHDLPSEIIAADPDIVFITMGLNDNFTGSKATPNGWPPTGCTPMTSATPKWPSGWMPNSPS